MPVSGPDYNREEADEAAGALLNELKEEYKLDFPFPMDMSGGFVKARAERMKAFREAVHGLFELHSWENW